MGFLSFLALTADLINNPEKTTFVVGNEAADMDSIVSALSYAYLLSSTDPDNHYIPLINIPQKDLALRTDVVYLFSRLFLHDCMQNLIFIDNKNLKLEQSSFVLTDHNEMANNLKQYADKVISVIDHHNDWGLYQNASPRIITPTGSATTLIVAEYLKSPETTALITKDLAKFLIAPILVDTINLDPKFNRVTKLDQEMFDFLYPIAFTTVDERNDFYNELQSAKKQISHLSTLDLLRKDYKEWEISEKKVGISSVMMGLTEWSGKADFNRSDFNSFALQNALDFFLVMTAFEDTDGFKRECLIIGNEKLSQELMEKHGFVETQDGIFDIPSHFSRKLLWPVVQEIIITQS